MTLQHLLVFAPTRQAASETFVRANLTGLPFEVEAYFGDERPLKQPARLGYGLAVLVSKVFTRVGLLRLAGWPAAVVARRLIARHRPDLVLVEFGFHAVRVMEAAPAMGAIGGAFPRFRPLGAQQAGGLTRSLPPVDGFGVWAGL